MQNQWAMKQIAAIQHLAMQQMQSFHGPAPLPVGPALPQYNPHSRSPETDDEDADAKNRTLFVVNLDDAVTEELLYEVFLQAGPIESVRIPKDSSGRRRCFGFITYVHECTPPYAMQIYQGLTLFRKSVTIKFRGSSVPPPYRPDPVATNYLMQSKFSGPSGSYEKYDNSALRNNSFPVCQMNATDNVQVRNPFHQNLPADWVKGSANHRNNSKDYMAKSASTSSRQHHKSSPYKRDDSQRSGSGNGGGGGGGGSANRRDFDHGREQRDHDNRHSRQHNRHRR